jgi:N-acetyl-gamma-glutamylphosphate reductase
MVVLATSRETSFIYLSEDDD